MINTHILLDIFEVSPTLLQDSEFIEKTLIESAKEAKATVLHSFFHKFGGEGGVTGFLALAESHISIHTWPENSFASIDIFMCGESNPQKAVDCIKNKLLVTNSTITVINRG